MIKLDYGVRIKEARKKKGMTQDKLAEIIGVTPQAISAWENGRNQPSYDVIVTIADVCGVPLEMLIEVSKPSSAMEYIEYVENNANILDIQGLERLQAYFSYMISRYKMGDD